jgi:hypothetical protein
MSTPSSPSESEKPVGEVGADFESSLESTDLALITDVDADFALDLVDE